MDPRFLELVRKFLETGVTDPNTKEIDKRNIGIPQGGILSPILCNVVMDRFDEYMNKKKNRYNQSHNGEYHKFEYHRIKSKSLSERRILLMDKLKIGNVNNKFDPNFRRMKYIRYADDFVILTIGTKDEAIMIKNNAKEFLRANCGVELKVENTVITNLRDDKFKFLGAEISKLERNSTFLRNRSTSRIKGTCRLLIKAPIKSLLSKMKEKGFIRQNNDQVYLPQHIGYLTNLTHYDIISHYNSKIYGILNFFSFASNFNKLGRIIWYLRASCALTLARKYKLNTMKKTFDKFGRSLTCPETDKSIFIPKNLRVKHKYQINNDLPKDVLNES